MTNISFSHNRYDKEKITIITKKNSNNKKKAWTL